MRERYIPDKSKPMQPFSSNVRDLKQYIDTWFLDYELIDYEREHELDDRLKDLKSYDELSEQLYEDS